MARHGKEELREQVWGVAHISDTQLRVTVREIRAALGDDADNPRYLETVPARGYRFLGGRETGSELEEPRSNLPSQQEGQPIVGRQEELEYLLNRLIQASKGRRQLVFVGGESGIGKNALVELFVNRLTGRPRTTCFMGQCAMSSGRSSTAC